MIQLCVMIHSWLCIFGHPVSHLMPLPRWYIFDRYRCFTGWEGSADSSRHHPVPWWKGCMGVNTWELSYVNIGQRFIMRWSMVKPQCANMCNPSHHRFCPVQLIGACRRSWSRCSARATSSSSSNMWTRLPGWFFSGMWSLAIARNISPRSWHFYQVVSLITMIDLLLLLWVIIVFRFETGARWCHRQQPWKTPTVADPLMKMRTWKSPKASHSCAEKARVSGWYGQNLRLFTLNLS